MLRRWCILSRTDCNYLRYEDTGNLSPYYPLLILVPVQHALQRIKHTQSSEGTNNPVANLRTGSDTLKWLRRSSCIRGGSGRSIHSRSDCGSHHHRCRLLRSCLLWNLRTLRSYLRLSCRSSAWSRSRCCGGCRGGRAWDSHGGRGGCANKSRYGHACSTT